MNGNNIKTRIKRDGRGGKREGAGRPFGSKSRVTSEFKQYVRQYTEKAIEFYVSVLNDPEADLVWKFAAADRLLDRGYGRPAQEVNVSQEHNMPVEFKTFEEVRQGLVECGLDIRSAPLQLVDLRKDN
jgi:hypothetical protein